MLDDILFQKLQALTIIAQFRLDYEQFQQEKTAFLKGEVHNPHLMYQIKSGDDLENKATGLIELAQEIADDIQLPPALKMLYSQKIADEVARIRLYQATHQGSDEQFFSAAQKLYGSIDALWWHEILAHLPLAVQKLIPVQGIPNPLLVKTVDRALKRSVADHVLTFYPYLHEIVKWKHTTVDAALIYQATQEFLYSLGIDDWKVQITESSATAIAVNSKNRIVNIPHTRSMSINKLQTILAHEIGTHVMRYVNGKKSSLQLLASGLSQYLPAEEGLATMCAQSLSKYKWKSFAGQDKYFAIGLAIGIDGHPRDFRAVFEIMTIYYFSLSKAKDASAQQKARERAWNTCVRIFRGTHGQDKGICYLKDLVYYQGNRLMWELVSTQPETFPQLFLGKFSPFESDQVRCLQELGLFIGSKKSVN